MMSISTLAGRGASITSKSVASLLVDLEISRSHFRPKVSNENPWSEAWFKRLKYVPDFPERFGSLADARTRATVAGSTRSGRLSARDAVAFDTRSCPGRICAAREHSADGDLDGAPSGVRARAVWDRAR